MPVPRIKVSPLGNVICVTTSPPKSAGPYAPFPAWSSVHRIIKPDRSMIPSASAVNVTLAAAAAAMVPLVGEPA